MRWFACSVLPFPFLRMLAMGGVTALLVLGMHGLTQADVPRALDTTFLMAQQAPSLYQKTTITLPKAQWSVFQLPTSAGAQLSPVVFDRLLTLRQMTLRPESKEAVLIVNGGFFDPKTGAPSSFVTAPGKLSLSPEQNPSLMQNPALSPYLSAILNRTELRALACDSPAANKSDSPKTLQFAIARHHDPQANACRVAWSLGAGPQLLPELTSHPEGFYAPATGTAKAPRDPIGVGVPNARTVVGVTAEGQLIIALASQQGPKGKLPGASLQDAAEFLKTQGAVVAMNLDGGSSSGIAYRPNVQAPWRFVFGQINQKAQPVERAVHSVLMLRQ